MFSSRLQTPCYFVVRWFAEMVMWSFRPICNGGFCHLSISADLCYVGNICAGDFVIECYNINAVTTITDPRHQWRTTRSITELSSQRCNDNRYRLIPLQRDDSDMPLYCLPSGRPRRFVWQSHSCYLRWPFHHSTVTLVIPLQLGFSGVSFCFFAFLWLRMCL